MAAAPQDEEVITAQDISVKRQKEPFAVQLGRAFVYPCKGSGILMLIVATAVFVVLDLMRWMPCMVLILKLLMLGYLCAYYISVIGSTAAGEDELPDWPDFSGFWDSMIRPLLLLLAAVVVSYIPLFLCVFIAIGWAFVGNVELTSFWVIIGVVCGMLYLPMSLLAIAMFNTVAALNPVTIIGTIVKIPLQYLLACGLFFLVFYVNTQIEAYVMQVPIAGVVAQVFLSLYVMMVAMRILGLIYYGNSKKIGWFGDKW
jgi:hypothetical protein